MNFSQAFALELKDVVAIIGSGGKTSLGYKIAKENVDKKVVLTTTTKVYPVTCKEIGVEKRFFSHYGKGLPNSLDIGVNVCGKFLKADILKITSLDKSDIKQLKSKSDLFIYEADGSKQKPLKAWNATEPVILDDTTKVIGVLPLFVFGKYVEEGLIHRIHLFCKKFNVQLGEIIQEQLLVKIIDEMFKKVPSKMQKILFFNYVANEDDYKLSWELAKNFSDIRFFAGSIKDCTIKEVA